MHIVIDAYAAEPEDRSGPTGIGRYTRQMIRWLPRVAQGDSFTVCMPSWMPDTSPERWGLDSDRVSFIKPPAGSVPFVSRHMLLPASCMARGGEVWFAPHGQIPWGWRRSAVVTIHDLSILDHPEWFPDGEDGSFSTRFSVPDSLERADRVIAVSEFTKKQIEKHFPDQASRARVVYEGLNVPGELAEGHAADDGEVDIILFIGTIEPRKNLLNALDAFDAFLSAHPERAQETRFYIVGKDGWKSARIIERIDSINESWESVGEDVVRRFGYVSDQEKWSLLQRAQALFFPSLEEGFGLPVLEAMGVGTPVVTSRRGAIPEVAGDTVFYVEPENIEQMALTLAQCLLLPEGVSGMTREAKKRAQQFSWESAAEQTLEVLREAKTDK